jgi:hypothetical protein
VIQVIRHDAASLTPRPAIVRHAVVTRGSGGAIVSCLLADDRTEITAIERFSYAVEPIVQRVKEIRETDPPCSIVVDAEGLGDAIWELLGKPRGRLWRLYTKHGIEREELTRVLLVAVARQSFRFATGLWEQDPMKKALATMTRNVREDGPGSELAVALSLALDDHRPNPPRIG